jgi:hypothetical protein
MGKPVIVVGLSDKEIATLKMWANAGKTEQRIAVRSRVILFAGQGSPLCSISREVGLHVRGPPTEAMRGRCEDLQNSLGLAPLLSIEY